jgi:transcriptional regulator with XRE-family HTH domain
MSSLEPRKLRPGAPSARRSSARLIAGLREQLDLSQQKFADLLDVTRLAASRWQSGEVEPSAANFIVLAKLAQGRGHLGLAVQFWERAGVTMPVLRALVPEIEESARRHEAHTFEPPSLAEAVRLPLLDKSFFEGDSESLKSRLSPLAIESLRDAEARVAFPSESVPRPLATLAVRAPDDYMRPIFRKGEFVAVEVPFLIPDQAPVKRIGQAPIAALYFQPEHSTSSDPRPGLHLREIYLYGPDQKQMRLDTAVGRGIAAARAFFKGGLEFNYREEIESASILVDGKNESEWSILGRVAGWLGSDREPRFDDAEE